MREGKGKEINVQTKERYEGDFFKDKKDGAGTIFYTEGNRFEGSFKKGKKDGLGKFLDRNGKLQRELMFEEGK